jgi:biopolymer transport protein TolQ
VSNLSLAFRIARRELRGGLRGLRIVLACLALGVAAITAVLAYNKINTDLARFAARLEGFATEFGAILSRQTEAAANDGGPRSPTQAAE